MLGLAGFAVLTLALGLFALSTITEQEWALPAGLVALSAAYGMVSAAQLIAQRRQNRAIDRLVRRKADTLDPWKKETEALAEDFRRLGDFWAEVSSEIIGRLEDDVAGQD